MAFQSEYTCPDCKYACDVFGCEVNLPYSGTFQTYVCNDCKVVKDIKIKEKPENIGKPVGIPLQTSFQRFLSRFFGNKKFIKQQLHYKEYWGKIDARINPLLDISCADCKGTNIKVWNKNCPTCNSKMEITFFSKIIY